MCFNYKVSSLLCLGKWLKNGKEIVERINNIEDDNESFTYESDIHFQP